MEEYEWINFKEMNRRPVVDTTVKIDPDASHIVGKPVRVNDPRLMKLVINWKRKMNFEPNGTESYNFYHQTGFVEDLKQVFNAEA
jgi:hypothetical protein